MKMSNVEKLFVNSPSHSRQVSYHAENRLNRLDVKAGQSYLDVGCGNGAAPIYLARHYHLNVTGIDVDPAQIQAAERASRGLDHARFLTLDGTQLPFEQDTFDLVATNKVMHHVPNWEEALAEMIRVLKPSGHLIYSDLVYPTWLAAVGRRLLKNLAGFPTHTAIEALVTRHRLHTVYFSKSVVQVEAIFQKG